LLGYRAGDTIEWRVPSGNKQVRIEEILYQPEAAGHFDL
jgi:regulator of nucleoside diphosphate kinase